MIVPLLTVGLLVAATCLPAPRTVAAVTPAPADDPPWHDILRPVAGERPPPLDEVLWREDLDAAFAEARAANRPLFVTMRCLPCQQCSAFDQDVLEGGPAIDAELRQFVTVRLTNARDVDLRLFPMDGWQDMDLSWWGWFLSPAGQVYGVFGGKDHVSDATRISVEALATAMRRVLDHHFDPRRADWALDGPSPDLSGAPRVPSDLPGYTSWASRGTEETDCLHCHQVVEILRQPAIDAGTFDKRRDVDVWPLPENVGLHLDRDDGLLVLRVDPKSPAEAAGLRTGDRLAVADGRRLFGQADFRGVLHRAPLGAATVRVRWWRGEQLLDGVLSLPEGWRKTVLSWRTSISQGNVGAHPGIVWLHRASEDARRKRGIADGAMGMSPWFGRSNGGPAWDAGLRGSDVIVAVDGESPDVAGREFMAWFRLDHEPGDTVTLTARDRHGEDREVTYVLGGSSDRR